ncbi:MAG TPA: 2'-5' RNA ligase family protein [Candidatus Limnocylindrales bacterium]
MGALRPSEASALVIRVELPAALAALRLRSDQNAADGVPAHVTLLYPFAEPAAIDAGVVGTVASIVGRHAPWSMVLGERRRWPEVLYASVEPDAPVRALQAELAAAFPTLPLGWGEFEFTPHVTIAEGPGAHDPAVAGDPAWSELPLTQIVDAVELIVRDADGRWRVDRQFPMRDPGSTA